MSLRLLRASGEQHALTAGVGIRVLLRVSCRGGTPVVCKVSGFRALCDLLMQPRDLTARQNDVIDSASLL